jgi:hypothetical protein
VRRRTTAIARVLGTRAEDTTGVRALDVNGHYVAYETYPCSRQEPVCVVTIHVRNVRTGRVRRLRIPDGQSFAPQVLVFADGSVAWTARPEQLVAPRLRLPRGTMEAMQRGEGSHGAVFEIVESAGR